MAERKFFVGGNFKMNGSKTMLSDIVANLNKIDCPNTGMVFAELLVITCIVLLTLLGPISIVVLWLSCAKNLDDII